MSTTRRAAAARTRAGAAHRLARVAGIGRGLRNLASSSLCDDAAPPLAELPSCSSLIAGRRNKDGPPTSPKHSKPASMRQYVKTSLPGASAFPERRRARRLRLRHDLARDTKHFRGSVSHNRLRGAWRTGRHRARRILGFYTLISMTLNVFDIDAAMPRIPTEGVSEISRTPWPSANAISSAAL